MKKSIIKKIIDYYNKNTLWITIKQYLFVKLRFINPVFYKELIKKKYNGGFYEKPKRSDFYDKEIAQEYLKSREITEHWEKEQNCVYEYLNILPKGIKVLDVPFGTGRFVNLYIEKRMQIFGLEISKDMISVAKNILGGNFNSCNITIGSAMDMPFEDNSFDLVVCFRFLPHILPFSETRIALKEISRISKKYTIIQIGEREKGYFRRRMPNEDEKMSTWLYPDEVEKLLFDNKLKIIKKSQALHPATRFTTKYLRTNGNWHAYLCEKVI